MTSNAQRLYDLLPAIYRIRDAEADKPLAALITVLAEQNGVLQADLEQLYDDQFIETCAAWVAPYIGDLIGYRTLHGASPKTASGRAEVANTIAYRRRKGTASVLEQLARDVTGWNARVVEYFQLLATTQYMNHTRPFNHYAPDLRQWELLERLHTPFERVAHTVDVGRIAKGEGLYNIPNIGIFLWRLNAYPLTRSPAVEIDARRFMCSPLGNNISLFNRPQTEDEITHLAEPLNVPMPLSRRVMHEFFEQYYGPDPGLQQGPDLSVVLHVDGLRVPGSDVEVCNLADAGGGSWAHEPQARVAIDPELGRIAFRAGQEPETVEVTYRYGFSADMGGGEYERGATIEALLTPVTAVAMPAAVQDALDARASGGVVHIEDSGRYEETLNVNIDAGSRLELRAANEHRPILVLGGELSISGGEDAEVTLNGLLITGDVLRVPAGTNGLRKLCLRHCTLVPGVALDIDGIPQQPGAPSLIVERADVTVVLDHCIIGGLRAVAGARVEINDSIVDTHDATAVALADPDDESAGAVLSVRDSTLIGKLHTRQLELASNVIFLAELAVGDTWTAALRSTQKQDGCVRFSYVPEPARLPQRYRCQPDLGISLAVEAALAAHPGLTLLEQDALTASVTAGARARIVPAFTDLRYGQAAYAQLSNACPVEIREGADDEAEMGVFHELQQPQRVTNLHVRLEEYLRIGLEAGVFFAS